MKFLMNSQGTILLPADRCKLKVVSEWEEESPLEEAELVQKIISELNVKLLQPRVFEYKLLAEVIGDYELECALEPDKTNPKAASKAEKNEYAKERICPFCNEQIYYSCYEECDEIEELRPEEYMYRYTLSANEYELAAFKLSVVSEGRITNAGKAILNQKICRDVQSFFGMINHMIVSAFEEKAVVHKFSDYSAPKTYNEPSVTEKKEAIQTWEGLQTSVKNILERRGILTLDDLRKTSDAELKKMRGMGEERIRLLREYVKEHFA